MNSLTIRVNLDWIERARRRVLKWAKSRKRRMAFRASIELDQKVKIWREEADQCEIDAEKFRRIAAGIDDE